MIKQLKKGIKNSAELYFWLWQGSPGGTQQVT